MAQILGLIMGSLWGVFAMGLVVMLSDAYVTNFYPARVSLIKAKGARPRRSFRKK